MRGRNGFAPDDETVYKSVTLSTGYCGHGTVCERLCSVVCTHIYCIIFINIIQKRKVKFCYSCKVWVCYVLRYATCHQPPQHKQVSNRGRRAANNYTT